MSDIKTIINDQEFVKFFIKNSTEEIKQSIINEIKNNNNLTNIKLCSICKKTNIETEFSKYKKYCASCFKQKQHEYYEEWKINNYNYKPTGQSKGRPKKKNI